MTSPVTEVARTGQPEDSAIGQLIATGGLRSVFQPIVDLESTSVVAYEALARGPAGPLESPGALFGAARRVGLLAELDHACRAAAFRGASAHGLVAPLAVFVNVEPEVLDAAPMTELSRIAEAAPGDLRVVLEVTERALAGRPAELLRTVDRVRELGWAIALDDVGAEPASLAFLSLLCPDVVKLDMSLTQGRPSPHIAEVISAVNAYAERSGALVLAEGIENERHVARALALGATLGQGWHFGRPTSSPGAVVPSAPLQFRSRGREVADPALGSPFGCLPEVTPLRRAPKQLLIEISKELEQEALRLGETCVIAATFQYARHFTSATARRYEGLVDATGFACAIGEGLPSEPIPGLRGASLGPDDPVLGEWDVVVLSPHFSAALLARDLGDSGPDQDRTFEYALTYVRETVTAAADELLKRVVAR